MKVRDVMVLAAGLVLAAMLVIGCSSGASGAPQGTSAPAATSAAQATSAPNPTGASNATTAPGAANLPSVQLSKQYSGTTLRVLLANHPWATAIKPLLSDFENQTGIKVNTESYGEDQLSQKITTEFTAGGSNIDVFMQRPLQEGRLYQQNGWYADLNTYLKDSSKTPSSYNPSDFTSVSKNTETINGHLAGVPIVVEQEVLYYRKDLLQQAGLPPPKTLDELQADAQKLTNQGAGTFGFVARGQRSPSVTQFSSFLYSYGGDWYDQQTRKATLNTPEAIAAFKFYGGLLKSYGPPGVLNMSWPQAVAVFGQGKVAQYTDANSIFSNLLDPKQSSVADKTGVAVFPAGPKGSVMYSVTSWGLSMAASSKQKDAAWEFIKWATSPAIVYKTQSEGAVPGPRQSVWSAAGGTGKFPADWVAAEQASLNGKPYDRPLVVQVGNARDIIGAVIDTAIQGGDVEAAANQANQQFQALLDSEKKP